MHNDDKPKPGRLSRARELLIGLNTVWWCKTIESINDPTNNNNNMIDGHDKRHSRQPAKEFSPDCILVKHHLPADQEYNKW